MTELHAVPAEWVTLRTEAEDGLPVVVVLDQAVVAACPFAEADVQIAIGVPYAAGADGLPDATDAPRLKELEQRLVDAAAGRARLVAVMTLDRVREWTFYGPQGDWAEPLRTTGLSVVVTEDPGWQGLRELAGLSG